METVTTIILLILVVMTGFRLAGRRTRRAVTATASAIRRRTLIDRTYRGLTEAREARRHKLRSDREAEWVAILAEHEVRVDQHREAVRLYATGGDASARLP